MQCQLIHASSSMLQLFQHQVSIRVLHHFMGFNSQQPRSSDNAETNVKNSIVALAHLDAFTATTVVCLQEDGTDTAGNHRQKLYLETIKLYVGDAYNQINGSVGSIIHD